MLEKGSAVHPMESSLRHNWSRDMAPAILILLLTAIYATLTADLSLPKSWVPLVKVSLRFLRFTLFLCFPLYALPAIYSHVVERRKKALLHVEQWQDLSIYPLKHWLFRPFQGIGIGFLFSTKLITILQVISGPTVTASLLIPQGRFELGRLVLTSVITIVISMLLSVLWTLDDLGIRYFNRRDHELKMIGKYVGTLMPVIFGFYGVLSLLVNYGAMQALIYVAEIVSVLYPPLAIFAVIHAYFIRGRMAKFSKHTLLRKGGVWQAPE
jgi:hypothetical protein